MRVRKGWGDGSGQRDGQPRENVRRFAPAASGSNPGHHVRIQVVLVGPQRERVRSRMAASQESSCRHSRAPDGVKWQQPIMGGAGLRESTQARGIVVVWE